MVETTTWTIKKLLDWTSEYFRGKGLASPRLNAEILLAEALHCARIDLYTRFDHAPVEQELAPFRDWVKRHAKGEPVAYLVGHDEFFSLRFAVNSDVLIPRPETELLVVAALDAAKSFSGGPLTIADVGTGSGCVAIAIAKNFSDCQICATDISPAALRVARINVDQHAMSSRISLTACDLLTGIAEDLRFHMIVSNPPYIGLSEQGTVDESVREYEPHVALYAGNSGTEVIQSLIEAAGKRLVGDGYLIFEISPLIVDRCLQLIRAHAEFEEPVLIKDHSGHKRIVQTRRRVDVG
jgi:release factor glutamine methyltransferase